MSAHTYSKALSGEEGDHDTNQQGALRPNHPKAKTLLYRLERYPARLLTLSKQMIYLGK